MGYGLLGVSKTSLASSKVTGAVNRLLLNSVVRNWRIIENQIRINLKEKRQPQPSMFDRIFRKIKSQKLTASREPQRHTWLFGVRLHSRHLCLTPLVSVLSLFAGLGKIDWRAKGKHTDRQMPPIRTRERPHPNQASKNILIYGALRCSFSLKRQVFFIQFSSIFSSLTLSLSFCLDYCFFPLSSFYPWATF